MPEFEKNLTAEETMIEDWPDPEDDEEDDEEDDIPEIEGPKNYEISFKAKGLTAQEVTVLNRYLFDAIDKELEISSLKLEGLLINED